MTNLSPWLQRTIVCTIFIVSALGMSAQRFTWLRSGIGPSFNEVHSLGIAPNGDLHLMGTFSDSITFGSTTANVFGNYDVFTARYNSRGQVMAVDNHGGFDVDEGVSVVVDNKGNYYFSGAFATEALIGGQLIETLGESMDMFVAKFDKGGVFQWVRVFGSDTYDESAPALAVDSLGAIYIAGGIGGTGTFGSRTYTSTGKLDAFIAKMSANGDFIWVQGSGNSENDMGLTVSVSPNGDRIYTTGTFIGMVNFQVTTIESFNSRADFFVRALNASGTTLWVKRIGYSGVDRYIASTTTTDGKLVLTGAFSETTTFDTQTLTTNGEFGSDFFICRIAKDGTIELLKGYGGTFDDVGLAVCTDPKGAIFVGGYFDSTTDVSGTIAYSYGGRDAFVARFYPNGTLEWYRTMGGPYDDEVRGVVVDSKNVPYITGVFDTHAWFDDEKLMGMRFSDIFVAALDCGPNTKILPANKSMSICEGQDTLIVARFGYPNYQWFVNGVADASVASYNFPTAKLTVGTHRVFCRVTGHDDCIKPTDTVTVVVREGVPMPTITRATDALTCNLSGYTYQWFLEGQPIAGANKQSVTISGNGLYRIKVTDSTGCNRISEPFLVGETSVSEVFAGHVAVYPNPTTGLLSIVGANGIEIVITNMLGQEIARRLVTSDLEHINITSASGSYAVTLRRADAVRTILITKQ